MSARDVRMIALVCDHCGGRHENSEYGEMVFPNLDSAREWAHADGWTLHEGRDVCRCCRCTVLGEHEFDPDDTDPETSDLDRITARCRHCDLVRLRDPERVSALAFDPVVAELPASRSVHVDGGAARVVPGTVRLGWVATDPLTVRIELGDLADVGVAGRVVWHLDRWLLTRGQTYAAGGGGLIVRPGTTPGDDSGCVVIDHHGPGGQRVGLCLHTDDVQRFLHTTYTRVPVDEETPLLAGALDAALTQILAAGSGERDQKGDRNDQ